LAPGASAKCSVAASSSTASSSTPANAAAMRAAGALGQVMRCQLTSLGDSTATTWSARGSSAGAAKPCRSMLRVSPLSANANSVGAAPDVGTAPARRRGRGGIDTASVLMAEARFGPL